MKRTFKACTASLAEWSRRAVASVAALLTRCLSWRGALELIFCTVLVLVAPLAGAAFATAPLAETMSTEWAKVLTLPLFFGVAFFLALNAAEIAAILCLAGVRQANDQFLTKLRRRMADMEAKEVTK